MALFPEERPMSPLMQAMTSPGMQIAGEAARNFTRSRMGQPTVDPIQAYQNSVMERAMANQRMAESQRAAEAHPLQMQALEQSTANQYAAYPEEWQLYQLSGSTDDFETWLKQYEATTSPTNALPANLQINDRLTLLKQQGDEEGYNQLMNVLRKPPEVRIGDATLTQNHFTRMWDAVDENGNVSSYRDINAYVAEHEGDKAYQKTYEQDIATQDAAFGAAVATDLPQFESALAATNALIEAIESGQYQETGILEGRIKQYTDFETAQLAAKAIRQTLENLKITNLAPVTEREIELVGNLYANVLKDPQANLGALEEAKAILEGKLAIMNAKGQYWVNNNGTLRGFGISERWQPDTQTIKADLPDD